MTSPFKREFHLKQHSHLLHFQYQQAGACLRATELKPKLDRFLIEHHFENDRSRYEKLLIGYIESKKKEDEEDDNQKKALNYKVSIQPSGSRNTCVYKGMGGDSARTGVLHGKTIISVFSYEKELLIAIEKWMEAFLALHNFGFRQSKGFGCYTLEKTKQKDFENHLLKEFSYFFKKEVKNPANIHQKIYDSIREEYQILKSGVNFRFYKKSWLFLYMQNKEKITWEKRLIKETLAKDFRDVFAKLKSGRTNNNDAYSSSSKGIEYRYVRALLGLAEHNEYVMNKGGKEGRIRIMIEDAVGSDAEKIKRFQSPLMFKIFDNYVYILPRPIPNEMFDRKFKFILKGGYSGDDSGKDIKLFEIFTPKANKFSMENFLDFALGRNKDWKKVKRNG